MNVWDDPRVKRGMAVQLERRRALIAAGGKPIGWKIGFGAKPIMERLKISGPLVGFLMQSGHVASGGTISLAGWTNPVAEPEVAVYMGKDLAAGADGLRDQRLRAAEQADPETHEREPDDTGEADDQQGLGRRPADQHRAEEQDDARADQDELGKDGAELHGGRGLGEEARHGVAPAAAVWSPEPSAVSTCARRPPGRPC